MGELRAHSFEESVKIFRQHKAVVFQLPMSHDELFTEFCQRSRDLQIKMERLTLDVDYNRGDKRHCVNHQKHIYTPEFYNIFDMMMEPGRWLFDLLMTVDDSLKFETCGGDVVLPGAPPSHATEWHQDWCEPGMIIAVSVALAPITLLDAPLWIATKASQVPCVAGTPGLVIVRDVSAWHRGSVHAGELARAMACFRFSSSKARVDGEIHPFRARSIRNWKPHLRRFIHLQGSISDPRTLFAVDEENAPSQQEVLDGILRRSIEAGHSFTGSLSRSPQRILDELLHQGEPEAEEAAVAFADRFQ
jgi:hypothetical protein